MLATSIITPVFVQFTSIFGWAIPLLLLIAFLKTRFVKGVFGEFQVNWAARRFLDKNVYHLFKNVTLPTTNGTTQIDHVIVSKYGIFVIETKNMKGWIFGDPNQKTWTQTIYRHTSKFHNPLRQNHTHMQILQSALGLDPSKIFSLVVFVGDSTFKTSMPDNVVSGRGYIRFIKNKKQVVLSDSEIRSICERIQSARLKPSLKTHIRHVRYVKSIVDGKKWKNNQTCPKCGKAMVLRTTRNGDTPGKTFMGCSGFPRCRTIKPMA